MNDKRISFSGFSKLMIAEAIEEMISNLEYHKGACPDIVEYGDDIIELENQIAYYKKLLERFR